MGVYMKYMCIYTVYYTGMYNFKWFVHSVYMCMTYMGIPMCSL